jgi:hypothetical protein
MNTDPAAYRPVVCPVLAAAFPLMLPLLAGNAVTSDLADLARRGELRTYIRHQFPSDRSRPESGMTSVVPSI